MPTPTPFRSHSIHLRWLEHPSMPSDTTSPSEPSRKRQRALPSCAECKRTKAKCNREWPCSECVRRGLEHLCPQHVLTNEPSKTQKIALLTARVAELEAKLRRLGQEEDRIGIKESHSREEPYDAPFRQRSELRGGSGDRADRGMPARPHDMTALLGRLALGPTYVAKARRPGRETAPFFLEDTDDDDEAQRAAADRSRWPELAGNAAPWERGGGQPLGRLGELSGALLDRCQLLTPSKRIAVDLWDAFWSLTCWRLQPMTPQFFHERIVAAVYSSEGPHLHQLAVLFVVAATVLVLDPSATTLSHSSAQYLDTAWACLVSGKIFTNTSLESLITLSLIGACLLNADDKKSPDANFAVFGMAVRLAVIAGYHRDPAILYTDMSRAEMDARRRIWYELLASDRLHSMPALLPNSVDLEHYDTKLPSDADPRGHFVWKWTIGVQICRVVNYWTSIRIPSYSTLEEIDGGIRRLLHSLPENLRCPDLAESAYALTGFGARSVARPAAAQPDETFRGHADEYTDSSVVVRQRIRLAMHFCMLMFYLHRPCFIRSLVAGDASMALSVHTMRETCLHVVNLTGAVMALDLALSRWFSFAADLYSVLHCLTLLIVKPPGPSSPQAMSKNEVQEQLALLDRGVDILQWTTSLHPSSKNRALLAGAVQLQKNAYHSRGTANVAPQTAAPGDGLLHTPIQPAELSPAWLDWLGTAGAAMAGIPYFGVDDGMGGIDGGMGLNLGLGDGMSTALDLGGLGVPPWFSQTANEGDAMVAQEGNL